MAAKSKSKKKAAAAKARTLKKKKRPSRKKKAAPTEYTYRGRPIRLEPAATARAREKLIVDGRQVPFERTAEGVTSHAFMYMVFGSPFELAEELVRQWGESKVDPGKAPPKHGHR